MLNKGMSNSRLNFDFNCRIDSSSLIIFDLKVRINEFYNLPRVLEVVVVYFATNHTREGIPH